MDLSGIIFVVLAVAWAVFLIPKALKQHDEVARTRSIDRFSTAIRVLAHREPVNGRDTRLVVTPARSTSTRRVVTTRPAAPTPPATATATATPTATATATRPTPVAPVVTRARTVARRQAPRAAARRRRRLLTGLLLCDVVVAVLAYLVVVPWWSVAIPVGLTVVYLVLCRTQVRHESAPGVEAPAARAEAESVEEVEVVDVAEVAVDEDRVAELEQEDTIGIPVALLQAAIASGEPAGTLWDPLPVTLPTYVTKPKAHRTVRTIDLGEPGTWTSGRTAQDAQIAVEAAAAESAHKGTRTTTEAGVAASDDDGTGEAHQRAVGS